ncbi:hypothetical protein DAI22_05g288600 [Oryza sativa Japonica Group]|nr:hypothetical protein DAI22_05g288600 [Oryza sativa Japonica Group]
MRRRRRRRRRCGRWESVTGSPRMRPRGRAIREARAVAARTPRRETPGGGGGIRRAAGAGLGPIRGAEKIRARPSSPDDGGEAEKGRRGEEGSMKKMRSVVLREAMAGLPEHGDSCVRYSDTWRRASEGGEGEPTAAVAKEAAETRLRSGRRRAGAGRRRQGSWASAVAERQRQRQQQASAAADEERWRRRLRAARPHRCRRLWVGAPRRRLLVARPRWGRRAAGFSSLAMALERGRTTGAVARWGRPHGRATAGRTTTAATTHRPANSLLAASIPTSLPLSPSPSSAPPLPRMGVSSERRPPPPPLHRRSPPAPPSLCPCGPATDAPPRSRAPTSSTGVTSTGHAATGHRARRRRPHRAG